MRTQLLLGKAQMSSQLPAREPEQEQERRQLHVRVRQRVQGPGVLVLGRQGRGWRRVQAHDAGRPEVNLLEAFVSSRARRPCGWCCGYRYRCNAFAALRVGFRGLSASSMCGDTEAFGFVALRYLSLGCSRLALLTETCTLHTLMRPLSREGCSGECVLK